MIHRPPIIHHRLAESPSFPGDLFIKLCDEYNKTTHTVFWKSYFLTFWFTLFLPARIGQNKVLITPQSVVSYWVIFHIHQNINLISRYTIVVVFFFCFIIFFVRKMLLDKVLQMFFFSINSSFNFSGLFSRKNILWSSCRYHEQFLISFLTIKMQILACSFSEFARCFFPQICNSNLIFICIIVIAFSLAIRENFGAKFPSTCPQDQSGK